MRNLHRHINAKQLLGARLYILTTPSSEECLYLSPPLDADLCGNLTISDQLLARRHRIWSRFTHPGSLTRRHSTQLIHLSSLRGQLDHHNLLTSRAPRSTSVAPERPAAKPVIIVIDCVGDTWPLWHTNFENRRARIVLRRVSFVL